jgi:hypothetical protein
MQDPELQLFFPEVERNWPLRWKTPVCPGGNPGPYRRPSESFRDLSSRHAGTAKLSFGERKLVVFASLLAIEPDIFLLDEPFAAWPQAPSSGNRSSTRKTPVRLFVDYRRSRALRTGHRRFLPAGRRHMSRLMIRNLNFAFPDALRYSTGPVWISTFPAW